MAEINFELYNNQLVQQLVGPQDANLKLIEQLLNVTIGSFGNQITIQGNGEAVEQARTAIDMLYNKLSRGIDITEQEVKAAVRMSDEGAEKILTISCSKPKNAIFIRARQHRQNTFRK